MGVDDVRWSVQDLPGRCCRCRVPARRRIRPYWNPTRWICPQCCIEVNALFDLKGWPPQVTLDRLRTDKKVGGPEP